MLATDSGNHADGGNYVLSVYSASSAACNIGGTGDLTVSDVQTLINQALGKVSPSNDLNGDGTVNVVDVQILANAVLGLGCSAS